ncbi:MAG: 30S ribosomal protein S16 [Alphaproteobacteria bacterium]|nr:30S ribosomal protein S16 [Alphaproteobacteria bacterium]
MALKIRLARGGAKKSPYYRIVVAESRRARDGAFIEKVGTYNPLLDQSNENRVTAKADRIKYWISVGAKPSDRVALLLSSLGLCEKPAITETTKKSAPKKKAQERLKAASEAAAG